MSVSNGQLANQTTFNNSFMSRTTDTTTTGKVDLNNTDPASGDPVINTQREINSLNSYTGHPPATAEDATPSWTNNNTGSTDDTLKDRAEALDAEFDTTSGHEHDGSDSKQISAANLVNFNNYVAYNQEFSLTAASGTSTVITTEMAGKTAGGGDLAVGVYTTAPLNRVIIVNSDSETAVEDAGGQRVYGRITESVGVWTLTYYTLESGVETSHSLSSQNIRVVYPEVFTMGTRPTRGADTGQLPSLDATADIADASATQSGKVNTGTQSFAGNKTFTGNISAANLSGTNTGDQTITLTGDVTGSGTGSFATTISANAVDNTKLADVPTQTFKGRTTAGTGDPEDLNISQAKALLGLSGTNSGDVTLAAIGAVPNANGASLSTQVLTLQPADATFGGVVTALAQTFAGLKTFAAGVIAQTVLRASAWFETDVENDATSGSAVTLAEPSKHVVRLTNASLVSITGITAPTGTTIRHQIIVNRTGVSVSVLNDAGTAANRILTGTGSDLTLESNASLALVYDATTAKWQIVGGSGSGGASGALVVSATANISAAGTITAAASQRELRRVQGNGAAVTANTTTPITAGTTEGQELILKGMSDTNTVTITDSGNVELNGDMVLYANSTLSLVWIDSKWLEIARKI